MKCRILAFVTLATLCTACDRSPTTPQTTTGAKPAQPIVPNIASITLSPSIVGLNIGTSATVTATVRDGNGVAVGNQTVTWTSGDTNVATVVGTGALTANITARGAGSVTVAALAAGRSGALTFVVEPGDAAFIFSPSEGARFIPMPAGTVESQALAINDAGQVAGYMRTVGVQRPFFWSRTTGVIDLGDLPGSQRKSPFGRANAINSAGEVAGWTYDDAFRVHAFKWTPALGMQDLGIPSDAIHTFATAINDSGVVVGEAWMRNGGQNNAFRWSPSRGMEWLKREGAYGARAAGINAAGVIVGALVTGTAYDEEDALGALWNPGSETVSFTACRCYTATAINNSGEIIGATYDGHLFRWTPTGGLVELASSSFRYGTAINDLGDVVGSDISGPFIWARGADVRALAITPRPFTPTGINHSGQIVGFAKR